jgi:hypothetical protein
VPNCKSFLVTEAERKHVRRRASLVGVACFLPGLAKDLSAPRYYSGICLEELKNDTENLRAVGVLVENRTKHLPDKKSFRS